jgi:N-acetylglucosaminyldiphosphoundecaprenol N-acetyl-beta-D-mannosaminyltransferase
MFPRLRVVEAIAPPFRDLAPDEDRVVIGKINKSAADIVFVALNSPRQEKWMAAHKGKIRAVQLSVGAAFDFITGKVPEAPKWMQDTALEWFFRLFRQPLKIIRRMSLLPEFILRLTLQIIKERCLGIQEGL